MDLTLRTDVIGQDKQSWLGSASGTDTAVSGVLAISTFTANTHYPDGYIRSGTPVAKFTSGGNSGKFGPYVSGGSNGSAVLFGFVLTPTRVPASGDTIAALMDGSDGPRIIVANLPITVDSAGMTSNAHFIYA